MSFETSDNLPKYFKSIQKLEPLSTEEEKSLAVGGIQTQNHWSDRLAL